MANAVSKTVSIFFIGANLIKIPTPTKRQVEPAAASKDVWTICEAWTGWTKVGWTSSFEYLRMLPFLYLN